jgi:hypothetical protein
MATINLIKYLINSLVPILCKNSTYQKISKETYVRKPLHPTYYRLRRLPRTNGILHNGHLQAGFLTQPAVL